MKIGERLKRLRLERGMTQQEVGEALGITKGAVQKYESGQIVNFRSDTIRELCDLFGLAPAYFIYDDTAEDYISQNSMEIRSMIVAHFGAKFVKLLDTLHMLNEDGRKKVYEYSHDLVQNDRYKRERYKSKKEESSQ